MRLHLEEHSLHPSGDITQISMETSFHPRKFSTNVVHKHSINKPQPKSSNHVFFLSIVQVFFVSFCFCHLQFQRQPLPDIILILYALRSRIFTGSKSRRMVADKQGKHPSRVGLITLKLTTIQYLQLSLYIFNQ